MNDEIKVERLKKFMNDGVMSEAVYEVLLKSFLKPISSYDVNFLAASRVAIDLLGGGFKELDKFKPEDIKDAPIKRQVGL